MKNKLIIAPTPHIHSGDSVQKNMRAVIVALIPAMLVSFYFFGLGAFIVTATSVAACVVFEYLITKFLLKKESTISDGSAVITGLLLAMNLPANLPLWMIIVGALFAIGVVKMSFGGLGKNPFNPALAARVFLLFSFPVEMTTWPLPTPLSIHYLDAVTGATPLALIRQGQAPQFMDILIGNQAGSLGEISAVALMLGGVYLLIKKVITWHIPVSIVISFFVFSAILYLVNSEQYTSPFVHLFTGGLLLGAIFMATDYVTSPMHPRGMYLYGVAIGVITVVIREFGAYPEGLSFAILIMNAFTPLINKYVKPKRFGKKVKQEKTK